MGIYDNNDNLISEIKSMSSHDLKKLSSQLRTELVQDVSKTGGHLASNLGIVELTVALYKVFDFPTDKLIWDVGHQAYIHKMITGRRDLMGTLRQHGGISGFPRVKESCFDMYDSGHSGTSISACLGYAKARDLKGDNYSCVAVIGDGALTSGVAWEALNTAGTVKTPITVILNDNEMSISGNVGGISKYLQRLRTSETYINLKNKVKDNARETTKNTLERIRDRVKYTLLPKTVFEELGFKYYGPIDGNNLDDLISVLSVAKQYSKPVLVHVITKKGKGFAPAEKNPSKFHGIGKFDLKTVTSTEKRNKDSWSESFGITLSKLAADDDRIVAVTAAMAGGTGLREMQVLYPSRVIDVGIAEQNAVSLAAGMALNGLRPVVAIYSTFLQRAYDMVITDVCQMNLPVIFAIDRAGITGSDGETHQGAFDISYLNAMPNMTILSPRDKESLEGMIKYALTLSSPVAIRYPRGNVISNSTLWSTDEKFTPNPQMIRYGEDVIILSDGNMLENAVKASDILRAKGIKTAVCDMRVLKPLNMQFIENIFNQYKAVVTLEDGVITGGFGSSVSQYACSSMTPTKVLNLGWPDKFIEHGSVDELRRCYGMDAESIAIKTGEFFEATIRHSFN